MSFLLRCRVPTQFSRTLALKPELTSYKNCPFTTCGPYSAISHEETNSLLIYEGDVIHHFKATDLSYVMIAITFVSHFISSFQRPIKLPVKLGTAKRKPKLREERKNEAIVCMICLPHHKRASSFMNTYKAARLHFLPMLLRYSQMSERVQHDEQCSSLHDR